MLNNVKCDELNAKFESLVSVSDELQKDKEGEAVERIDWDKKKEGKRQN